ncbi:MAG TPA: hypothetical protein VKV74_09230 [Bryobacteraceae bacterium]|nr:hypothetical protein [Bryobacteraceae bacterium]
MFERYTERAKIPPSADLPVSHARERALDSAAAGTLGNPCIEAKHPLIEPWRRAGEPFFDASAAALQYPIPPEPPRREKVSAMVSQPTEEIRRGYWYSREQAGLMGHKKMRAGHLALGWLQEETCPKAEIPGADGLSLDHVRRAIVKIGGPASSGSEGEPGRENYV